MTMRETLGFVGLGVMGGPMSGHLATKSGHRVIAFDAMPDRLEAWLAAGGPAAASVAEIMQACDIVFLSLPSGRHLEALCREEGGLLAHAGPGKLVVDLGTSPPALSRELAEAFAQAGTDYADAPVARTRKAAEEGTLAVTVGASDRVFARLAPLLRCFASEVTHCGEVGAGQLVKILNNMVVVGTVVALCEAAAVANAAGMDTKTLFDAFAKGSADSFALRNHGYRSVLPQHFPEQQFSTDYMLKDIGYALEMGAEAGIDMAQATLSADLLRTASQRGLGERYWPVIFQLINGSVPADPPASK